jgi:hypothetical protein
MHRRSKGWLGTALAGAMFLAFGVNGLRLADRDHTGVFFRLAWMSPLQAYIASAMCLGLGLSLIVVSLLQRRLK